MNVAFDYDGVITSNYVHYAQLIKDFMKSNHRVFIITAANNKRYRDICNDLLWSGIDCEIISRPKDFTSSPFNIGTWKKIQLLKHNIDIWWDNEIKQYEQAGVDFSDLKIAIIRV